MDHPPVQRFAKTPINANLFGFSPMVQGIGLNNKTAPKNSTKADTQDLLFQKYLHR